MKTDFRRSEARSAPLPVSASVVVELAVDDHTDEVAGDRPRPSGAAFGIGLITTIAFVGLLIAALGRETDPGPRDIPPSDRTNAVPSWLPVAGIAASRFEADPSARDLRVVLAALGGLEGLTLGVAEGSFEKVWFDPDDSSRLSASVRREMGWLERGADNEQWLVADGNVIQTPVVPSADEPRPAELGEQLQGDREERPTSTTLSLDDSGHLTLTIDTDGPISVNFDGSAVPLLEVDGLDAVVSADRSTVAVKRRAWPTAEAIWQIIDVDLHSWLARARDLAGQAAELAPLEP